MQGCIYAATKSPGAILVDTGQVLTRRATGTKPGATTGRPGAVFMVYSFLLEAEPGVRPHPGEDAFMPRQNRLERFWSIPSGVDPKGDGHEARRNDRMSGSGTDARIN